MVFEAIDITGQSLIAFDSHSQWLVYDKGWIAEFSLMTCSRQSEMQTVSHVQWRVTFSMVTAYTYVFA